MSRVARALDMLKLAQEVLKTPEKHGADLVRRAQQIVKEEKGVSNATSLDISKFGDTVVTDANAMPGAKPNLGKVTVKGAAAVPMLGNPLQMGMEGLQQAYDQYGAAKEGAANAIANQLDVRANPQQPSAAPEMSNIIQGAADVALPFAQGGTVPKPIDMSQWQSSVMDQPPTDMSQMAPQQPGMVDVSGQGQLAPVSFSNQAQQPVNMQPMPEQQTAQDAVQQAASNVNLQQPQQQQPQPSAPAGPDRMMQTASNAQDAMAKHAKNTMATLDGMLKEAGNISNEIRNGHIDPNAYLNSMTGADKASTAIGLILSGLGSGMSGQPNMAMDFLTKQIDRDVHAQTLNMDKKQNLLHALHQQMGDVAAAQTMYKGIMYDQAAGKIAAMAAKSNDPAVHMRAQQAIQALAGQINPAMLQIAQRQAIVKSLGAGEMQPEHAIAFLPMSEHEKSEAYKEIGTIREIDKTSAEVSKAMQEMGQLASAKGRLTSPLQSRELIAAKAAQLQSMAHTMFSKTSDNEFNIIAKGFEPGLFTSPETLQKKIKTFNDILQRKRQAPVMTGQGIPLPQPPTVGTRPNKF